MYRLSHLLGAALLSVLVYLLVFAVVIHKPMTIGIYKDYYGKKLTALAKTKGRKIVILAGSNGRFSHSCAVLAAKTGFDCVNMSISVDLSYDYQFDIIKPHLKAGDLVYLPVEYEKYSGSKWESRGGSELPFMLSYDRAQLLRLDGGRLSYALFYADLSYALSGIGEMLLSRAGVRRRYSVATMNEFGDETGHMDEKALLYRDVLRIFKWRSPRLSSFDERSYSAGLIAAFLRWAAEQKVQVVGGLPTTFDDAPVPAGLIAKIRTFYEGGGQYFVKLGNNSQYPRAMFYDTPYHLREKYQRRHSAALAPRIKEIMVARPAR